MTATQFNPHVHGPLSAAWAKIYAPPNRMGAREWAEANIVLTPEESRDRAGPYRATPAGGRVLDFLTNRNERELIVRKSSQPGFTLASLIGISFYAATNPGNWLYAIDSTKEVVRISTRLRRILTTNRALSETYSVGTGEKDDLQNYVMHLRGMDVWFIGSGAKGGFANKSATGVVLDELDLHLPDPSNPVDTIDRARERVKQIANSKLIAGGKPEGWLNQTNQAWLTGTREEIHVPCPRCGHYQPVRFEALKFKHCKHGEDWNLEEVMADTFMECEACKGRIDDREKPAMLAAHRWVAANKGHDRHKPHPGRASLWISDLTETTPKQTWGHIAAQFIDAQDSPSKLNTFFLGVLALPKEEKKTELDATDIRRLSGPYEHGCMPVSPAISPGTGAPAIFISTDRQLNHKRWVRVGFAASGEGYVIDYGRCLSYDTLTELAREPVWIGATTPPEAEITAARDEAAATGRDFLDVLREKFPDRPFHTAGIGIIDEGFDTYGVRDFCYRSLTTSCPIFPCKGVSHVNSRELVSEISDRFRTTKEGAEVEGPFLTVYHFNDDAMKMELYLGRIPAGLPAVNTAAGHLPNRAPRLWLPANPDADFCAELSVERRISKVMAGRVRWVWEDPGHKCNDGGDAVKTACVLWQIAKHAFAPTQAALALDAGGHIVRP